MLGEELIPEPEAAKRQRLATQALMYPSGDVADEDIQSLAFPPGVDPAPTPPSVEPAPLGPPLSRLASDFARKFPEKASRILEWAADTHEPRKLNIDLGKAQLSLLYVKSEKHDLSTVFYLDVGAPGLSLGFGTELSITYEGKSMPVLATVAQEVEGRRSFPYTRLEFFHMGPHTPDQ